MSRRDFLKLCAAVGAAMAVPLPPIDQPTTNALAPDAPAPGLDVGDGSLLDYYFLIGGRVLPVMDFSIRLYYNTPMRSYAGAKVDFTPLECLADIGFTTFAAGAFDDAVKPLPRTVSALPWELIRGQIIIRGSFWDFSAQCSSLRTPDDPSLLNVTLFGNLIDQRIALCDAT